MNWLQLEPNRRHKYHSILSSAGRHIPGLPSRPARAPAASRERTCALARPDTGSGKLKRGPKRRTERSPHPALGKTMALICHVILAAENPNNSGLDCTMSQH